MPFHSTLVSIEGPRFTNPMYHDIEPFLSLFLSHYRKALFPPFPPSSTNTHTHTALCLPPFRFSPAL